MKGKARAILVLVAGVLCLAFAAAQAKFGELTVLYRQERETLEASARQLRELKEEMGQEAQACQGDRYIEIDLCLEEAAIVFWRAGMRQPGAYDPIRIERPAGDFPQLAERLEVLRAAGIGSIEVYDHSGGGEEGSPCEVWYGTAGGSLVWSESGWLTHSYDVTIPDGGGYRFYQKALGAGWFAAVSRYDPSSLYWRM